MDHQVIILIDSRHCDGQRIIGRGQYDGGNLLFLAFII